MIQIPGVSALVTRVTREKVSVTKVQMLDGRENFFVGFRKESGATEYLIVEKNGEAEPSHGPHQVSNRHNIERFYLSKIGDEYEMEATHTA